MRTKTDDTGEAAKRPQSGSFREAARRVSNGATTSSPMEHMNGNSSYVTVPFLARVAKIVDSPPQLFLSRFGGKY